MGRPRRGFLDWTFQGRASKRLLWDTGGTCWLGSFFLLPGLEKYRKVEHGSQIFILILWPHFCLPSSFISPKGHWMSPPQKNQTRLWGHQHETSSLNLNRIIKQKSFPSLITLTYFVNKENKDNGVLSSCLLSIWDKTLSWNRSLLPLSRCFVQNTAHRQ